MADDIAALGDTLVALLGEDRVLTSTEARESYSADLYARGRTCAAVIRPADRDALAGAVAAVTRAGYALMPRGAGLTYSGGYTPVVERCVVVDLSGLDRIVALNPDDMTITVEAGCTWRQIHDALATHGLRLPCFGTFSGARATVGGGLSGGAVFLGTARYGAVADALLALEVVLADGAVVRTGHAAFDHAGAPVYRLYGPDLTGLFVHDSGALGIKTLATFRVIRAPAHTGFASFAFADADAAARAQPVGGGPALGPAHRAARGARHARHCVEAARRARDGRGAAPPWRCSHVLAARDGRRRGPRGARRRSRSLPRHRHRLRRR